MATIDRLMNGGAAQLALSGTMNSGTPGDGGTFVTTGTVSGWPATFGVMVVDPGLATEEKILYSNRSGNTFTVATGGRGFDGTSAAAHGNTAVIIHTLDALVMTALVDHVNNVANDHHTQYLNTARHDLTARHAAGSVVPVAAPGAVTPGASVSAGVSGSLARADHVHSLAGFGTTGDMAAIDLGDTVAAGSSGRFADAGHQHAAPTAAVVRDAVLPSGVIMVTALATASTGWHLCDGSAISRATFANLFAAIGTSFGAGDGTTTFNVPNLKGKVVVGIDAAQTEFDTRGEAGGEKTHVLLETEMASHHHAADPPNTVTDSQGVHNHTLNTGTNIVSIDGASNNAGLSIATGGDRASITFNGAHQHNLNVPSFNTADTGADVAHNNLQPYMALNYMIKD